MGKYTRAAPRHNEMRRQATINDSLAQHLSDKCDLAGCNIRRVEKFAAQEGIDSEIVLVLIRENIRRGVRCTLEEHLSRMASELANDPSLREALGARQAPAAQEPLQEPSGLALHVAKEV